MVHVTPQRFVDDIMQQGLTGPVYLHLDEDTAEDALGNWMVEKFPDDRLFAFIEVDVNGLEEQIQPDADGFMMGSYFISQDLEPSRLRVIRTEDVGEE